MRTHIARQLLHRISFISLPTLVLVGLASAQPAPNHRKIEIAVVRDINCDGKQTDSSELSGPGIPFSRLRLSRPGLADTIITTNGNGFVGLLNLPIGTYKISQILPSGWTQTFPSTLIFTLNLISIDSQAKIIFGNCERHHDSLSIGTLDSGCCNYHIGIVNASNFPITSIDYILSGGTVKTMSTSPAATSSSPASLPGTTSGHLLYSTGVMGNVLLAIQAPPTVKNTPVSMDLIVHHGGDTSRLHTSYTCRAPQSCDKLTVVPFWQQNIDYSCLAITITNMQPSPICSVGIKLLPEPASHSGGGLRLIPPPASAPAFRWPYNRIPSDGTMFHNAVNGSGVNSVQFNLGVNYNTVPLWSGTLNFEVQHCDGSTCFLTYSPCGWTPKLPVH